MSARQVSWAHAAKARLISQLGGACWACGSAHDLHIDHPAGRNWSPAKKGLTWRISIYRREAREGLVRLLCGPCNVSHAYEGVELARPPALAGATGDAPDGSDPF